MAKKAGRPRKQDGKNRVVVYLDDPVYEGLRRICFDEREKHSNFIKHVLAMELKKRSYLQKSEG